MTGIYDTEYLSDRITMLSTSREALCEHYRKIFE